MRLFRTKREFFAAIAKGDAATVQDYLKKNKDWLDKTGRREASPAHMAAEHGQLEILRIILAAAPKLAERRDLSGRLPLHVAAAKGQAGIAAELLDNHDQAKSINRTDYNETTPLQEAITHNSLDVLRVFLASGKADLTKNDPPALYHAVDKRRRECVALLLEAGANPNTPHVVPIKKPFRIFFPDYGPIKNSLHSPLMRAIEHNETQIALDLMEAGARAEGDLESPLHEAARNGNTHLAHALLDGGHADVNARNFENRTALHVATERNNVHMVEFLLSRGAQTDFIDINGNTPLDIARQYARRDIIDLLRDSRPAPEVRPVDRKPPPPLRKPAPAQKPAAANGNAPAVDKAADKWELNAAKDTLVHTHSLQDGARKLTEIFNFKSRERVVISQNIETGAETMGPHESFDAISEESLTNAFEIFRKKGGQADEAAVFKNRIIKPPVPKSAPKKK